MPAIRCVDSLSQIPTLQGWGDAQGSFKSKYCVVDASGKPVSIDNTETWYQISDKKERSYTPVKRIVRAALGVLCALLTGGLAPFLSKSVKKLFTKSGETVRYAVKTEGSQTYRAFRDLEMKSLSIQDSQSRRVEPIVKTLGSGASKQALELSGGKVLLIPTMDTDRPGYIAKIWPRIVDQEVAMCQRLTEVGLLALPLEKVSIYSSPESTQAIPALRSESFEQLAKSRGLHIVDRKNPKSSSWKKGSSLFAAGVDRKDPKNWEPILKPLHADIAKVAIHNIPFDADNSNLAIVKGENGFEARYFGFDFSAKEFTISIPKPFSAKNCKQERMAAFVEKAALFLIELLCIVEFKAIDSLKPDEDALVKELVKTHTGAILAQVEELKRQAPR